MKVEVIPSADLAGRAAEIMAARMRAAIDDRGRCALALSRGENPAGLFEALASQDVSWDAVDVFQVDERQAPDGHAERNLTLIQSAFGSRARIHPMPVLEDDLDSAARRYGAELEESCGRPPVLDVVHLGLGADGHTASLLPGDPVLEVKDGWVGVSDPREGRRRLTLTYPALRASRYIVFVVSGDDKAEALAGLIEGDPSLPASHVDHSTATVVADDAAARRLNAG